MDVFQQRPEGGEGRHELALWRERHMPKLEAGAHLRPAALPGGQHGKVGDGSNVTCEVRRCVRGCITWGLPVSGWDWEVYSVLEAKSLKGFKCNWTYV